MGNAYGAQGPVMLGITWTEATLALILILLRAKAAAFSPDDNLSAGIFGLRWDFLWVIMAMILALTAQSFMTVSAVYGIGNHESALSQSELVKANLWSWVAQIVAILTLVVARIAIISLLLAIQKRMSQRTYRFGRRLIYFVGTLQGVINVAEVILILQQCDPVQKLWNPTVPGTCSLIKICSQVGYLQGTIGVFADLLLAFYPIYIFTRLHQETRVRIGLCLIMGGGVIAAIAGICKTIAISSITHTTDITYEIHKLNTWVLTEMWFIIIFGSIPVLRSFFMRFFQNVTNSSDYPLEYSSRTAPGKNLSSKSNWLPLDAGPRAWTTCEPSTQTGTNSRNTESEEGLTDMMRSGQITVTQTAHVEKEDR